MRVLCKTHKIWSGQVYSNISPSELSEIRGMQSGFCAALLDKLIVPENVIGGGSMLPCGYGFPPSPTSSVPVRITPTVRTSDV